MVRLMVLHAKNQNCFFYIYLPVISVATIWYLIDIVDSVDDVNERKSIQDEYWTLERFA